MSSRNDDTSKAAISGSAPTMYRLNHFYLSLKYFNLNYVDLLACNYFNGPTVGAMISPIYLAKIFFYIYLNFNHRYVLVHIIH